MKSTKGNLQNFITLKTKPKLSSQWLIGRYEYSKCTLFLYTGTHSTNNFSRQVNSSEKGNAALQPNDQAKATSGQRAQHQTLSRHKWCNILNTAFHAQWVAAKENFLMNDIEEMFNARLMSPPVTRIARLMLSDAIFWYWVLGGHMMCRLGSVNK